MNTSKSIKLCDDCESNPPKTYQQIENSYKLICSDCSKRENRHSAVEHWIDFDEPEPGRIVVETF